MEYIINGDSMYPYLKDKMHVTIDLISFNEVSVGNIVAYYDKSNHNMVVHRVIKKTKEGIIFKGDNNWHRDNIVYKNDKLLFVKKIQRNEKYVNIEDEKLKNSICLLLSITRIIPLLTGRQCFHKYKINGEVVSKKEFLGLKR